MRFPLEVAIYRTRWDFSDERRFLVEGHAWVATVKDGRLVLSRQLSNGQKMSVLFADSSRGLLRTVRGYIELDGVGVGDFIDTKEIKLANLRTIIEVEALAAAKRFLADNHEREADAKKATDIARAAATEKAHGAR